MTRISFHRRVHDRWRIFGGALVEKAKEPALFRIHDVHHRSDTLIPLRTGGASWSCWRKQTGTARLCRTCLNRLPTGRTRRNAANYAAAFNEAGDLRSGKPRAARRCSLMRTLPSPIRRYPIFLAPRGYTCWRKSKGTSDNTTETGGYHYRWKRCCSSASTVRWRNAALMKATRDVPTG